MSKSTKKSIQIDSPIMLREKMNDAARIACEWAQMGTVTITIECQTGKRTELQNKRMWAMLTDISRQKKREVNGQLETLSPEDWKDIFTAGIVHDQRVTTGLNGGFVMLGVRTSKSSSKFISQVIELLFWFGAENKIIWSDPEVKAMEKEYEELQNRDSN